MELAIGVWTCHVPLEVVCVVAERCKSVNDVVRLAQTTRVLWTHRDALLSAWVRRHGDTAPSPFDGVLEALIRTQSVGALKKAAVVRTSRDGDLLLWSDMPRLMDETAERGHLAVVAAAMEYFVRDESSYSSILTSDMLAGAAERGDVACLRVLLHKDVRQRHGRHSAIIARKFEVAVELAAPRAVRGGHLDVVEMLVDECGLDLTGFCVARDMYECACWKGFDDIARFVLLGCGIRDAEQLCQRFFLLAAQRGRVLVVRTLHEELGVDLDAFRRIEAGPAACYGGSVEMVQYLHRKVGMTASDFGAYFGLPSTIRTKRRSGPEWAVKCGHLDVLFYVVNVVGREAAASVLGADM